MPTGIYERPSGAIGGHMVEKPCERCGAPFMAKRAHLDRRHYCSNACKFAARREKHVETRKCAHCGTEFEKTRYKPQRYCSEPCRKRGEARAKDGAWRRTPQGYIVSSIRGRTVMQHRVVMEQKLGRELRPYENVHHINGKRDDNRPENLELWVRRQPYGQRAEDVIEWAIALLSSHGYSVTKPSPGRS